MAYERSLHAGHRERLRQKFLNSPDSFSDHELLELLLCEYLPRVNTNDLAHELLNVCGSVKGVFGAKKEELTSIRGIGENTAEKILLLGKIYDKLIAEMPKKKHRAWINSRIYGKEIRPYFDDVVDETIFVFFLNNRFVPFFHTEFCDKKLTDVSVDLATLTNLIALKKPHVLIVAHNHPSNIASPSKKDDLTAMRIAAICSLHGCGLADCVILTDYDMYSYKNQSRFALLRESERYREIESLLKE